MAAAQERGGIELTGVAGEGVGRLELATTDLGAAIDGADLVMLTVAGPGLEDYARRLAPLLRPGPLAQFSGGRSRPLARQEGHSYTQSRGRLVHCP